MVDNLKSISPHAMISKVGEANKASLTLNPLTLE